MCGGEHKFKPSSNCIQIFLCLPGCMGGVVIQYEPYFVPFCRMDFKYDLSSSERKIGVALFGIILPPEIVYKYYTISG